MQPFAEENSFGNENPLIPISMPRFHGNLGLWGWGRGSRWVKFRGSESRWGRPEETSRNLSKCLSFAVEKNDLKRLWRRVWLIGM